MGITPGTFSSGSAITVNALTTELNRVRNWANTGMVVGDLAAASIDDTHIYRPETFGYPKGGTEGQMQDAYGRQVGVSGPVLYVSQAHLEHVRGLLYTVDATGELDIARSRGRRSVFLNFLSATESATVADMVARVYLDQSAVVEVNAQWSATTQYDPTSAAAAELYPSAAAQFRLVYSVVGSGTNNVMSGSRRRVNAAYATTDPDRRVNFDYYSTAGTATLSAGVYDIRVEVVRNSGEKLIEQLIVDAGSIVVEVHK